jgi:hypothetical protein
VGAVGDVTMTVGEDGLAFHTPEEADQT